MLVSKIFTYKGENMKIEVLAATMNQTDHSLINKMNIQTDAIIANQCEENSFEKINHNGNDIKFYSFAERGVGLNRNNALMRSEADICVLADDDMVFIDNYEEKIRNLFDENPNADVIILNLHDKKKKRYTIKEKYKVRYNNFMRFGAARIVFRRNSITKNSIFFNLHFGGGTQFSAGEDALFLAECLKKKLNIIAVPEFIAELSNERDSTWFDGFTDKYFIDKGVLYAAISKRLAWFLALQYVLRRRYQYEGKSAINVWKLMSQGIKQFRNM